MKKYVIICKNMHRAKQLWIHTLESLYDSVSHSRLYPIYNIETNDGVSLNFVSVHYWYDRGGRLGRHDWKPFGETDFENMLDAWKEKKCIKE